MVVGKPAGQCNVQDWNSSHVCEVVRRAGLESLRVWLCAFPRQEVAGLASQQCLKQQEPTAPHAMPNRQWKIRNCMQGTKEKQILKGPQDLQTLGGTEEVTLFRSLSGQGQGRGSTVQGSKPSGCLQRGGCCSRRGTEGRSCRQAPTKNIAAAQSHQGDRPGPYIA